MGAVPFELVGAGQNPRAPRTNLLLSATVEAGPMTIMVRIRNLSESGAMLEGRLLPEIGRELVLRRLDLAVAGTVVWRTEGRCGIRFDGAVAVPEWVAGRRTGPGGGQAHVDAVQAALRTSRPVPVPVPLSPAPASAPPALATEELDRRIAEEISYVRRLLETIGDELSDEPIVMQRHGRTLQSFDLACQILGHLSAIVTAPDRQAAVGAISLEDLRARLARKAIF